MPSQADVLFRIRHSLAHLLAQAVQELRPGARLGFGPPIENGFYYDFLLPSPLYESDFVALEARMRELIAADLPWERDDLPIPAALARIDEMGEPYKSEWAAELVQRDQLQSLSFYRSGAFVDLCEGPHVARSSEIPPDAFKLRSIAGAYWRGREKGPGSLSASQPSAPGGSHSSKMMTRIYAWAFASRADLENAIAEYELAQARDHKKLGRELDLFVIDDEIGKGLPLWLPNGTVIRDELEKLMRELEFKAGYQRVVTPHLARSELYHQTGHLPYYAEGMYPPMEIRDEAGRVIESYHLRPMNCPHHHRIFAARPRSYRDLPLRLAEYGQVYRYEDSGAISGLLRVRGMCQNDAHIYVSPDIDGQIESEIAAVLQLYGQAYRAIGITDFKLRLSLSDADDPDARRKFVDPAGWARSEALLRRALVALGAEFEEVRGEAAFYGPKIDVQLRSVTGREETASTVQLDFAVGARMKLSFTGADNADHAPWILHRAPLGTHERMVAFLIERWGGAFPTWLAPVQVRILPVRAEGKIAAYAREVEAALREHGVRAEVDGSSERLGRKIAEATSRRVPHVLVIGDREAEQHMVAWRVRGQGDSKAVPLEQFVANLLKKIARRELNEIAVE